MANRVGVIFHNSYSEFSPLLYSHFGGDIINTEFIQEYLNSYRDLYPEKDDGHKYDCEHMMYGFLQGIGVDLHNRICNVNFEKLIETQNYPNCFESGCYLVNIDYDNYGLIENK